MACHVDAPQQRKIRKLADERRVFREKWELQFFCTTMSGKIHCLICNSCIGTPKEYNLRRHYETNHTSYNQYEGQIRVARLKELKTNLTQQQTFFKNIQKVNVASVTASFELSRMIAKSGR